jgi:hypothetical protein
VATKVGRVKVKLKPKEKINKKNLRASSELQA